MQASVPLCLPAHVAQLDPSLTVAQSDAYLTIRAMKHHRGQRQGVENLWVSRSGQRTKLYGKGKQYRARYVDTSGKEHTRRFQYKADATDWLKQITRSGVDIAPPVTGEWTVAQQFSLWIRKADIAETTRATRQHTWRAHVADKWGDLQCDEGVASRHQGMGG